MLVDERLSAMTLCLLVLPFPSEEPVKEHAAVTVFNN